jgi:predicted transcriptional regulator
MHNVEQLLIELIAQLESSKPNPVLWNSSAARALERQVENLQHQLRRLQHSLIQL